MRVKKTIVSLFLLGVLVALLPWSAAAQMSSINAFSPYSMFGIGEMNTQGAVMNRSMGGVGIGMRSAATVNLLNPAAYSATMQRSFLFNFGVEGQNYYNAQNSGSATKRTSYNSFNIHDVAIQLPVAKGLGLGFSFTPLSSVGYRLNLISEDDEVLGNIGGVNYLYQGEGDVTEVKAGLGWEIFKNFSIGVAAQYYWGDIDRSFVMTPTNITGSGSVSQTSGNTNYSISRFKGQAGVQWTALSTQKRLLIFGATFDIGGDLRPQVTNTIYVGNMFNSTVRDEYSRREIVLPMQVAGGVFYQNAKMTLGADYVYQSWNGNTADMELTSTGLKVGYTDTHTVKLGAEFIPNRFDVRHFMRRVAYRVGARAGNYHQTFGGKTIGQYAVTAGVGIPVKFMGLSAIDVAVEFGGRGAQKQIAEQVGMIRQHYFKFSIGLSLFGEDYWFVRPKFD